jgi:hypothetical protein
VRTFGLTAAKTSGVHSGIGNLGVRKLFYSLGCYDNSLTYGTDLAFCLSCLETGGSYSGIYYLGVTGSGSMGVSIGVTTFTGMRSISVRGTGVRCDYGIISMSGGGNYLLSHKSLTASRAFLALGKTVNSTCRGTPLERDNVPS